jgi:hypothetical protein
MGSDTPKPSINLSRLEDDKARARWTLELARRREPASETDLLPIVSTNPKAQQG